MNSNVSETNKLIDTCNEKGLMFDAIDLKKNTSESIKNKRVNKQSTKAPHQRHKNHKIKQSLSKPMLFES